MVGNAKSILFCANIMIQVKLESNRTTSCSFYTSSVTPSSTPTLPWANGTAFFHLDFSSSSPSLCPIAMKALLKWCYLFWHRSGPLHHQCYCRVLGSCYLVPRMEFVLSPMVLCTYIMILYELLNNGMIGNNIFGLFNIKCPSFKDQSCLCAFSGGWTTYFVLTLVAVWANRERETTQ